MQTPQILLNCFAGYVPLKTSSFLGNIIQHMWQFITHVLFCFFGVVRITLGMRKKVVGKIPNTFWRYLGYL